MTLTALSNIIKSTVAHVPIIRSMYLKTLDMSLDFNVCLTVLTSCFCSNAHNEVSLEMGVNYMQ